MKEAFLETNLPFLDSGSLGKANLNLAGRWTDYSTSGVVYTWKIGGTWDTPYEPVRLRAVFSRDVRAPNLSELFAAPVVDHGAEFHQSVQQHVDHDPAERRSATSRSPRRPRATWK